MTERFVFRQTPLRGLCVIERKQIRDERGYFERVYCFEELRAVGLNKSIRQINRSLTRKCGTVRGLHFQHPPHAEIKLISCLRGRVYDVAVDLRRGSPTFLQFHTEELSQDNHRTMIVPEGFAHGFQTLADDCELLYFHTADYEKMAEAGIDPRDPKLAVNWPKPIAFMSEQDSLLPPIPDNFVGISL